MPDRSIGELKIIAGQFNELYPVGSLVKVRLDGQNKSDARVKYPAEVIFNESVKVMVYEAPGYHDIYEVFDA